MCLANGWISNSRDEQGQLPHHTVIAPGCIPVGTCGLLFYVVWLSGAKGGRGGNLPMLVPHLNPKKQEISTKIISSVLVNTAVQIVISGHQCCVVTW